MNNFYGIKYRQVGDNLINYSHTLNSCFEIIQTWSDDGTIMIGDVIYPMKKGAVYFIGENVIHYINASDNDKYERNKALISNKALQIISELCGVAKTIKRLFFEQGHACIILSEPSALRVDGLFREMEDTSAGAGDFAEGRLTALFLLLLEPIIADINHVAKPVADLRIQKAIEFIKENLDKELNADIICRKVFLSKHYFCHLVKKTLGVTTSQYITDSRIAKAKDLLAATDLTISQVGTACGFSNFAYFSRVFREKTKMSPMEFRKYKKSIL